MNRHHPYGGSFEAPSSRRGGSPSGPGPDRHRYHEKGGPSHRGGRGGFGRGRGGGGYNGNYDGPLGHNDPYDQGYSQGTDGYYNGYDTSQQAPYYQNSYGDGSAGPYGAPPSSAPYNQDYGRYEDGPTPSYDNSFDDGYNRGGGGGAHRKGGFRRERGEAKVVDEAVIEERIQREKPCRTLFIRNIKYETDSADVKRQFEEHGDIKTFFDLISTRGMVFVTYYDLRAAERARDRLQGSEIGGRPIDVHYSLPRDDARGDREKNQQLQGTLQLTIRNSLSGQPLDDNEVRRKFQQYGDVKSIRPANDRPDSRYVEFYDMRAAEEAFDRLRHQPIQDGVMDIVLAWDPNEPAQGQGKEHGRGGDWGDDGHRGGGRGRGRGGYGRGFGRGRGGGGAGGGGYEDRRGPVDDGYSNRFERGGPRGRGGGRFEEDGYGGGGRGGRGGGYGGDRFDSRGTSGGYGPPPPDMGGPGGYVPPPPIGGGYPPGPPPPAMPPQTAPPSGPQGDDRLEQARKVQQLLAALKQPTGGAPSGPTLPGPPAASSITPPGPSNGAPAAPYYAQPPPGGMGYPPGPPPPNPSMYPPPVAPAPVPPGQSLTSQPGAAPPGLENLPPNLLAMLQAAQRPPSGAGTYPPTGAVNGQPSNAQYYALMGYLQQQQQQAGAKQ